MQEFFHLGSQFLFSLHTDNLYTLKKHPQLVQKEETF